MANSTNSLITITDTNKTFKLVTDNIGTGDNTADDRQYILLNENNKVFLQSKNINVFPCSRRGSYNIAEIDVEGGYSAKHYDPEARLNTERTNRIHTAINGFTDSFIDSFEKDTAKVKIEDAGGNEVDQVNELTTYTLTFVLAGYHIEARGFDPNMIAEALGLQTHDADGNVTVIPVEGTKIYAYLSLHPNVSLDITDYYTEILARQSDASNSKNYLDVLYKGSDVDSPDLKVEDDFFVGISFVAAPIAASANDYNLELFSYNDGKWELTQTSLLPKIEHGDTEDSIKISGDFTIKYPPIVDADGNITEPAKTVVTVTKNNTTINVPTNIVGDTGIDGNTDITGNFTVAKLLTSKEIKVPSEDGSKTTSIDGTGISTFYTYTEELAADGISVGGELSIVDNLGSPTVSTIIGAGTIIADTEITVKQTLNVQSDDNSAPAIANIDKAIIDNITVPEGGQVITPTLQTNSIISGPDTDSNLTVTPPTTFNSTLTINDLVTLNAGLNVAAGTTTLGSLTVKEDNTDYVVINANRAEFNKPVTLNDDLTVSTGDLTVSEGNATLKKLDASDTTLASLKVATDKFTVTNTAASFTVPVTVNNNLTITGANVTTTPTLKVNTITSDTEVKVDKPLKVNNTLDVNNGKTTLSKGLTVKEGLTVESGAAVLKSTLAVSDKATLAKGLEVTNGDTSLQALNAGTTALASLKVATNKLTVTNETANFKVPVTIDDSLEVTTSVKTPALNVQTIENEVDDTGVSINDPLNITTGHAVATDTLNVNTISSRVANGTITVESPVILNNNATLTLNKGLTVAAGDATIQSNLKVEDNINVGTPATPATADNGGYIVAKKDITAEQDLKAGQNISAGANANIAVDLTVGTDGDTNTGTITAKKLVKTPTMEATTEAKTPLLTVTGKADITTALNVHNTSNTAKITADRVQIDKDLIVYDTITATKIFSDTSKNNLVVNKASITTLSSDDLNQKIGTTYYDVPVIFVQQLNSTDSNEYQLQISRANALPYKNN